jgi:hypothetical protein
LRLSAMPSALAAQRGWKRSEEAKRLSPQPIIPRKTVKRAATVLCDVFPNGTCSLQVTK